MRNDDNKPMKKLKLTNVNHYTLYTLCGDLGCILLILIFFCSIYR
jgi:hypothetical protein